MVHGLECFNVHLQLHCPIGRGRGRLLERRRSAKVTIRHRHGRYFGQGSLHSEWTRPFAGGLGSTTNHDVVLVETTSAVDAEEARG